MPTARNHRAIDLPFLSRALTFSVLALPHSRFSPSSYCATAKTITFGEMKIYIFLFLSVTLSLPYGPGLLTLLHECESSCVLVYFNGRDSFVHFSIVLF